MKDKPLPPPAGDRLQVDSSFRAFRSEDVEQTIASRFEKQAERFPHRLAVKTERDNVTYEALNARANQIAHTILSRDRESGSPVIVLSDTEASTIAAMFGVWKAQKIYVPLDVAAGAARGKILLEDTRARSILANEQNLSLAQELAGDLAHVIRAEKLDPSAPTRNPSSGALPDDPALILYTSGSTGRAKGIVQNHRNPLHHVMITTHTCRINEHDRMSLIRAPSFVGGAMNVLCALLNGAALLPFNVKEHGVASMLHWLLREQITFYHSGPSLFRHLIEALTGAERFPHLRLIRLSGEQVTRKDVEDYKKYFAPSCVLMNALSSTEAITFRQYFVDKKTPMDGDALPAGYPVQDLDILLVDEDGNDVRVGEIGEIVIKSRYLFPGYWQEPQLTKRTLLPAGDSTGARLYATGDLGRIRPDGCLEHLGRKDFKVKIRGYSVETADVETALLNIPGVKQSAVVAPEDHAGNRRLVAYIVPQTEGNLTTSALRRSLSESLPDYCLPSTYVFLNVLPITPSGKIDRRALPLPDRLRPQLDSPFAPARTAIEEALAHIWRKSLNLDQVGIHDHFLELGGDSLLASQLVKELSQTFGLPLSLKTLFEAPSVAELALALVRTETSPGQTEKIARTFIAIERMGEREFAASLQEARRQRGDI